MAKCKNRFPEQIVRKLRTADELAAGGASGDEIARQLGISTATPCNWHNCYGVVEVNEARELRKFRDENAKLKRLVAEEELHILGLNEIAAGNF